MWIQNKRQTDKKRSVPHRSTHILQHLLVLVLSQLLFSYFFEEKTNRWIAFAGHAPERDSEGVWLGFARGCNWIKMLLHSVSFCSRATKTYARGARATLLEQRAARVLTTEIIHFQNEWNERSSEQKNGKLAMHGINERVRCVWGEGSSGRQPHFIFFLHRFHNNSRVLLHDGDERRGKNIKDTNYVN